MKTARIMAAEIRPYRIPLRARFSTGHGAYATRHGAIVIITADSGARGIGELVALPEFGTPPLREAVAEARAVLAALVGQTPQQGARLIADAALTRSVDAALDCALGDLRTRHQHEAISALLRGTTVPRNAVPINATLGAGDLPTTLAAARQAVALGFGTVKLKIGNVSDPLAAIAHIAAVRDAVGADVRLRIDANEAWSVFLAQAIIPQLTPFNIEYIEQPIARDDEAGLAALHGLGTPIAADEALLDRARAERLLHARAIDVVIVKPTIWGSLAATMLFAERAACLGMKVVITSSLESGIGVAAALHIAASLPDQMVAHGLATLDLLEDDLIVEGLPIVAGQMALPVGPGLGVTLDIAALDRYAFSDL